MTWTSGEATRYGAPVLPDSAKMLTTPRGSEVTSAMICETRLATSAVCPGIFDRDGVPRGQGGSQGPDEQGDGGVPRDDDADDAGRLPVGAEPLPRCDLGRDAGIGQGHGRVMPQRGTGGCPLEQAFGDLLAVLLRHQRAQFFGTGVEPVGHLAQGPVAQAAVAGPGRG